MKGVQGGVEVRSSRHFASSVFASAVAMNRPISLGMQPTPNTLWPWPRGERPAGFREPLTGDVPVLAITGELDPVTPPRYGEAVVEHLPNGRHLVLAGQGHSVLGAGCMPELFAQFLETADADALDADCLSRLRATPPFAGHYGWEP